MTGVKEISITLVKCRDCDTMISKPVSGPGCKKKLCDPCVIAARRKNARECNRRTRNAEKAERPPRTCKDCGADIGDRGRRAIRCVQCANAGRAEYQRLLREANPTPLRRFYCITCGTEIDRVGNSGKPLYCPTHADLALQESQARSEAKRTKARGAVWATHCHYCNAAFDRPRMPARSPARCDECKRQVLYAYKRALTTAKRPTVAPCRDCAEPVPLKRKGRTSVRCGPCVKKNQKVLWLKYAQAYRHMRRAWKYAVGYEKFSPKEIYDRDGWRCGVCRKMISKKPRHPDPMSVSLDHKISLSRGGPHSRANTQPAHLRCNIRKNKYDALPGEQMPLPIVF